MATVVGVATDLPTEYRPGRSLPQSYIGEYVRAPSTWRSLPHLREQIGVSSRVG
jgi:hypothetical protein